jgi:transmembrane 9 superfamily protein 2/4
MMARVCCVVQQQRTAKLLFGSKSGIWWCCGCSSFGIWLDRSMTHILFLAILLSISSISCLLLPGVVPYEYNKGDPIGIKIVKLDSAKTALPYEYYSLPFCYPKDFERKEATESLGEVLSGDVLENSPYIVLADEPTTQCRVVCQREYQLDDLNKFADKIEDEYRVHWLLDNLPAATKYYSQALNADEGTGPVERYEKGFALGFIGRPGVDYEEEAVTYLNNHLKITVLHHEDEEQFKGSRIVGFEVEAKSVKHKVNNQGLDQKLNYLLRDGSGTIKEVTLENSLGKDLETCGRRNNIPIDYDNAEHQRVSHPRGDADRQIIFTYEVEWKVSDIKWVYRWDSYLKMAGDSKIHWFSIINSIMIVLFLSGTTTLTSTVISHY